MVRVRFQDGLKHENTIANKKITILTPPPNLELKFLKQWVIEGYIPNLELKLSKQWVIQNNFPQKGEGGPPSVENSTKFIFAVILS